MENGAKEIPGLHPDSIDELTDPRAISQLRETGGASLVREMVDLFATVLPANIMAMELAFAAHDRDELHRQNHKLKSSCYVVGAVFLLQVSDRIEQSRLESNEQAVAAELLSALWQGYHSTLKALAAVAAKD